MNSSQFCETQCISHPMFQLHILRTVTQATMQLVIWHAYFWRSDISAFDHNMPILITSIARGDQLHCFDTDHHFLFAAWVTRKTGEILYPTSWIIPLLPACPRKSQRTPKSDTQWWYIRSLCSSGCQSTRRSVCAHISRSTRTMLFYLVLTLVAHRAVMAEEPMDLTRVSRGALYIRLPARKFTRLAGKCILEKSWK